MNINFKKVITEKQIIKLSELAEHIWHEAFKNIISTAQIEYMLEKFQSVQALTNAINNCGYQYYFICSGNEIAGYTGIQPADNRLFLSKLYILKEKRGLKLASRTFEFIENMAKNRKLKSVWLTVNIHNTHAISVYKAKGMNMAGTQVADIGGGFVMDDYIFEKEIK